MKKELQWKIDKNIVGTSAVLNEIGTHAYHLATYISGLKGKSIFADIKQISKKIKMDDNAQVMINFANGAKGMLWTSVMARGGVYGLRVRVFGTKGSLEWVQNDPGYLRHNPAKGAVRLLERGFHNAEFSKNFSRIKFGHPEGYLDAFANIYKEFASSLKNKTKKRYKCLMIFFLNIVLFNGTVQVVKLVCFPGFLSSVIKKPHLMSGA